MSLKPERMSDNAYAQKLSVSGSLLRKYVNDAAMPRMDKLIQIAKATGVSINWLATGEDGLDSLPPMMQSMGESRTQQEHGGAMLQVLDTASLADRSMILLPKLDVEASAGGGVLVDREDISGYVAFDAAWLRARHITPQGARILTARGDSMEPTIRNGDFLIVDTAISEAVDSGIYVVVYNGLLLVKRLFLLRNSAILISSDNKIAGRDEEIPPHEIDQLHIAGRVMWYGRGI